MSLNKLFIIPSKLKNNEKLCSNVSLCKLVNKFHENGGLEKIISSIKNFECSLDVLFFSFKVISEIYKFINIEFTVKFLDQYIEYSNQYLTKYFETDFFKNEIINKFKNVPINNKEHNEPNNENDDDSINKFNNTNWYKAINLLISLQQYTYIIVKHLEIESYYAKFFLELGVNCLMKSKEASQILLAIRIIIDVLSKINIKSLPCFEEIKKVINKKNLITNLLEVFQYENTSSEI